jgi:hypothetical protein
MKLPPFPGVLTKQVSGHYAPKIVLTDEQRAWLFQWYPEVENARIMEASGLRHATLHRFAREFGLKKSEQGMHGIMKRQAKLCKKICEQNGWYASLRGKPVSEATRQGTAKMWQDIRDGKREHPILIMKRKNPTRYRRWLKNKSEECKETIRKERLRATYGLKRKTKLRVVVLYKYTKSQTAHRYNALRRGYYVMEDCSEQSGERYNIYYDEQTQRGERFEHNLIKDGFKVLKWE